MRGLISFILLLALFPAQLRGENDSPALLEYHWGGALSAIESAEVRVESNGSVHVRYKKQAETNVPFRFELNEDELAALRTSIWAAKFFEQPTSDTAFATDTGDSILTVNLKDRHRTLRYQYRPEMDPLLAALHQLIQQAVIVHELEQKGDVYQTLGACSPHFASAKVFSPRQLIAPLKAYLFECNKQQKLEWGYCALAWQMSEQEWLGFVSLQLEKAPRERRILLLNVLCAPLCSDNLPASHAKALMPLLTLTMEQFIGAGDKLDPTTDKVTGALCRNVGRQLYKPAFPTLKRLHELFPASEGGAWAGWAIQAIEESERKTSD